MTSVAPFVSYAQNGEDVVLRRVFADIPVGRYVDVGANDPVQDSLTKAFYDAGWRGMTVEPMHAYAQAHREQRPGDVVHEVVAGAAAGSLTFYEVPGTGLSSVHESVQSVRETRGFEVVPVEVPARRLDDLLAEAGWQGSDIHFLNVDVEGAEDDVFAGLDLREWRPWVVVVEALDPETALPSHGRWEARLTSRDYRFVLFDGLNRFYLAAEHWDDLHDRLAAPANILDNYETHQFRDLRVYLQEKIAELANLKAEFDFIKQHREAAVADRNAILADREELASSLAAAAAERDRLKAEMFEIRAGLAIANEEFEQTLERSRTSTDRAVAAAAEWRTRAVGAWAERTAVGGAAVRAELDLIRVQAKGLSDELAAMKQTVSWKVTRPLRAVRSAGRPPRA